MKNRFFKKMFKSLQVTAMSALTVSFLTMGLSMTALADEPDEVSDAGDFSEYVVTETYDFEDGNNVTFEDYINYEVDIEQEYTIPAYNASTFAGSKLSRFLRHEKKSVVNVGYLGYIQDVKKWQKSFYVFC